MADKSVKQSAKGHILNKKWWKITTFIITASNFGNVCKRRLTTPLENLVKQLRANDSYPDTLPMQYCRKQETQAKRDYTK